METLTIRRLDAYEWINHPDRKTLIDEYAKESSLDVMPEFCPDYDMYRYFDSIGIAAVFGAFKGESQIGFGNLLVTRNPHYSCLIATVESVFVRSEHRNTGAGLERLKAMQDYATKQGAVALFVSAGAQTRFAQVLARRGFTNTNMIFAKKLN